MKRFCSVRRRGAFGLPHGCAQRLRAHCHVAGTGSNGEIHATRDEHLQRMPAHA